MPEQILKNKKMGGLARALRNTVALSFAELTGKGLSFLLTIVLVRYLDQSAFGEYTTVMTWIWFLVPIVDIGVSQVVTREIAAGHPKPGALWFNALWINLVASTIAWVWLACAGWVGKYSVEMQPLLFLAGLAVLGNAIIQTTHAVLRGLERMDIQAILNTIFLLLASLVGIGLAVVGYQVLAQILWATFVAIMGAGIAVLVVNRYFVKIKWLFDPPYAKGLVKKSIPIAVLVVSTIMLRWSGVLILSQMRPMDEVAVYGAATKIIDVVSVISMSAALALFPILSRSWIESVEKTRIVYRQAVRFFVAFGIVSAVGLTFLARPAVLLLFGETYHLSILPVQLLAWAFFFQVVTLPMGMLLIASGDRFRKFMPLLGGIVIVNLILNLVLIDCWGVFGTALAFLITTFLLVLANERVAMSYFQDTSFIINFLPRPVLAGIGMGVVFWFSQSLGWIIPFILSLIAFVILLWSAGEFQEEPYYSLRNLIKGKRLLPASLKLPSSKER